MTTHQHNPVIRGLYILAVLGMFTFFTLLVRQYATAPSPVVKGYTTSPEETVWKPENATTTAGGETRSQASLAKTQAMSEFYINGKQYSIYLGDDAEGQINKAWMDFAEQNLLSYFKQLVDPKVLYQSYSGYSADTQSVNILIGYASEEKLSLPNGYMSVRIPAGNYWQAESVLTAWNNVTALPVTLTFQADYERFEVDDYFRVQLQTAYLNVK